MKTFYIEHIGCERRGIDAEKVKTYLEVNKLKRITKPEKADYLFLFTCSFGDSVDKCLGALSQFNEYKGKLTVCGCLPAVMLDEIRSIFNGNILETQDLNKIDDIFPDFKIKFNDIKDPDNMISKRLHNNEKINSIKKRIKKLALLNIVAPLNWVLRRTEPVHTNQELFSVRISWGCMGNCSYCRIKKGIGKMRSKNPDLILKEFDKAIAEKKFNINLISADTGSYGLDIETTFPALLKKILMRDKRIKIDIIKDIHSNSIYWYKDELAELAKTRQIRRIRIGVQSGSKRILKLMRRNLDFDKLRKAVRKIKEANPKIKLSCQIIVGFPTETEEEFKKTINFIKSCKFDECQVFGYFENKNTESFEIEPKVPQEIINKRVKIAEKILNKPYYNTNVDREIGKVGISLKKNYPGIYYKLKRRGSAQKISRPGII